jgi:hypothetical protein
VSTNLRTASIAARCPDSTDLSTSSDNSVVRSTAVGSGRLSLMRLLRVAAPLLAAALRWALVSGIRSASSQGTRVPSQPASRTSRPALTTRGHRLSASVSQLRPYCDPVAVPFVENRHATPQATRSARPGPGLAAYDAARACRPPGTVDFANVRACPHARLTTPAPDVHTGSEYGFVDTPRWWESGTLGAVASIRAVGAAWNSGGRRPPRRVWRRGSPAS